MKEIKESESRVEISVNIKHNTLSALAFPFKEEALDAYDAGTCDYVQLAIGKQYSVTTNMENIVLHPQTFSMSVFLLCIVYSHL